MRFQKDEVDKSYVKSHAILRARSHNCRFCDHGILIAFFFGISSNKQIIVKKAI